MADSREPFPDLSTLLRPLWTRPIPNRVQYRGGWLQVPARVANPRRRAAAEAAEWPVVGGGSGARAPSAGGRISFAQAAMAGRGNWRGGRQAGAGGGRGNWPPSHAAGDWTGWRGPPAQQPLQAISGLGGGFGPVPGPFVGQQGVQQTRPMEFFVPGQAQFGKGTYHAPVQSGYSFEQQMPMGGGDFGNLLHTGINAQQNAQGSGQNNAGFGFVHADAGSNSGANSGDGRPPLVCYKCEHSGHGIKDCKTALFCVNFTKRDSHLSQKCSLLSQPKAIAGLIGMGADGLQMLSARTGKKPESDKTKEAIAVVTVKDGVLTAQQLVNSLSMMFQWGWEWQAKPYLQNKFLVKFPSKEKIDEMKVYNFFGLIGSRVSIQISRWTNSLMASYKLYVCCVTISGVPETLQHYQGFCEVGSLIGEVLDIDMELYRQCEVLRAKIGVMDPRKIPSSVRLNEGGHIYDIYFDLEDIVEEGGPMEGGILVSNPRNSAANASITEKRPRDKATGDDAGCSKSPRNQLHVDAGAACDEETHTEEVISSQYEVDMNLIAERETRKKLLEKKVANEKVLSGVEQVNAEFAKDSAVLEDFTDDVDCQKEDEFDCTQDPDDFARRLGIGTQKIGEINEKVDREMLGDDPNEVQNDFDKENEKPVCLNLTKTAALPGKGGGL